MITRKEALENYPESELTPEQSKNLDELLIKVNKLRESYGKRLKVSSGVRTMKRHLDIYAKKGITDKTKIPMKSKHLSGEALDLVPLEESVADFQKWIKNNEKLMEEIGLWFEDFSATVSWVHMQSVPPKSGKRFFLP